ncbi:MAG: efflux RND transporter periplasmic adaptor subunit [Treponema sp.]|jgi:RND family efflux transporter MFP subunit|nr:efflux RND transporter periplasmic adaptor subunit [Treponema sp.]
MSSEKKNKHSLAKFAIFAALVFLFAVIVFLVIRKENLIDDEFTAPVITIKPALGSLEKTLRITSHVETGRLITVVPRTGGTLIMLGVRAGDNVTEGQLLAIVDSAPHELTFTQAQSAYLTASSTFEMISELYQSQGVSRQNYEEARMAFDVARAQYELAQLNMDYTRIRSPMNATVLMRHGTEGGLVAAGTPLVTLGDLGDLRIKAAIPEIHYRFFADNWRTMPVRLHAPALGETSISLRPLSLAPYVSPENRSFIVEYEIPRGAASGLRPGMFVNVIFTLDKRDDIYYLPFKALTSGNRLWYAGEGGKAQPVDIALEFSNNDYFQIPAELHDRIFILEGQHFLNAGQRVNILSEAQALSQ